MGRRLNYRPGSFYRVDDRTGFAQRAERTKKEWNGQIVDEARWEARQPQDFVRGVRDFQGVPEARPLAPNVFVGPYITTLSSAAAVRATVLPVDSVGPMAIGDALEVMLDGGAYFRTFILGVGAGTVTLADPLPYTSGAGAQVVDLGQGLLQPLQIAATPDLTATVGVLYSVPPVVTGGVGALTFAGISTPGWATCNSLSGLLSGIPSGAEVDAGVSISVTDALGRTTHLTPWTITVSAVALGGRIGFDWSDPNQSIGIFV